ncbi:transcription termination factor MTEF1, chloroplastic-like [Canna indica]|uniref:Transcription termination factor MTEF1, chloroplastic-like n=1 Tax=Canna indica TaxID=4628 RepID=A0AAQ3JXG3_9LILI|nr:transcription termination factor MTEF1, chloroplastic-like [Canna indica]
MLPLLASLASVTDAGLHFREKLLFTEHDLGVDSSHALSLNPSPSSAPLCALRSSSDALRSFGLLPADVSRVFAMYLSLLTCDPSPTAIPFPNICKAVIHCPRVVGSSVLG